MAPQQAFGWNQGNSPRHTGMCVSPRPGQVRGMWHGGRKAFLALNKIKQCSTDADVTNNGAECTHTIPQHTYLGATRVTKLYFLPIKSSSWGH